MKLTELASKLDIKHPTDLSDLELYNYIRKNYFDKFRMRYKEPFQSPSVEPTTIKQRSAFQFEEEHSVYQRSDYTSLSLENNFNSLFPELDITKPSTLAFNSGMAAISCLMYLIQL